MKLPDTAHGILAHYFHGPTRPQAQGSLSADDFERGLDAYASRLVRAGQWEILQNRLTNEVVVTLDDGLREQVEIALPVLERWNLTSFWNIYTQPYVGVPHSLERYRWLRNFGFGSVDAFYDRLKLAPAPSTFLAGYEYLSQRDRDYRYWRDSVDPWVYVGMMEDLFDHDAPTRPDLSDHWIRPDELRSLHGAGHVIGFHSHTHPTTFGAMSDEHIETEYATSRFILAALLGVEPHILTTCATPCGNVTTPGLAWMRTHGITLGWGATMDGAGPLNMPRLSTGYWRLP